MGQADGAAATWHGPLLEVDDLRADIRTRGTGGARDGVVHALAGVSLSVGRGECLGVVGESGSGKTITALSVLRLLPPGAAIVGGRILLDGREITSLAERDLRQIRGSRIAMIFQDPGGSLDPVRTVGSQVAEAVLLHRGPDREAAAQRAVQVLGQVGIAEPERVAASYPHQLSGGQRQRAAIAMALACEPELLIADEPTTALDAALARQILQTLDRLRHAAGMAVMLISHDLGVVAGRADRVAVMYAGRVVECAPAPEVLAAPRHPYTAALIAAAGGSAVMSGPGGLSRPAGLGGSGAGCSFAPRCDRARGWCSRSVPPLDGDHPGHSFACFFPLDPATSGPAPGAGSPAEDGRRAEEAAGGGPRWPGMARPPAVAGDEGERRSPPLLSVKDLVKEFPVTRGSVLRSRVGTISAVAGVSFTVAAGRTLGLVGESGSGKTTLARLVAGLERPDAGLIEMDGAELTGLSRPAWRSDWRIGERAARRARGDSWTSGVPIQLMFQDSHAALDPRMRARAILREPLSINMPGRRRSHRRLIARIADEVGLPAEALQRFPHELSGGQRQRLALARALILQPRLIVADEPVSSLDVSVRAQVLDLMRTLQRRYGLAYLLISHDLDVVRRMADRVAVMYLGKLMEIGPVAAVCASPAHPYTRALVDLAPSLRTRQVVSSLAGDPPPASDPPSGCRFRTRCARAEDICAIREPPLAPAGAAGQLAACHFPLQQGRGCPPAR
jgi:peptide/nickel transport system ATP-binding protein